MSGHLFTPTKKRFVNFNDPSKPANVLDHCGADFVAHEPSGLVGTEAHVAEGLKGAHTFLANQHQVRDSEPILKRLIRIFENRSGKVGEAVSSIAARSALRALPTPSPRMKFSTNMNKLLVGRAPPETGTCGPRNAPAHLANPPDHFDRGDCHELMGSAVKQNAADLAHEAAIMARLQAEIEERAAI
jgi:hypothetical protein